MKHFAVAACLGSLLLVGCVATPRLPPPPELISRAAPVGFSADVRLVSTDSIGYALRSAKVYGRVAAAATDGSVDYLVLSGGGSAGAFGAGALVGLERARARPQFEVVTGVSAGALLAPFAFLGPQWDRQLREAFDGRQRLQLLHGKAGAVLARLLFPRGAARRSALGRLVNRYVTDAMVQAVAAEWQKGRLLFVATTDLDKRETVLWNMGLIAAQGGDRARTLFRDVLVASASVPGVFPPVLIRVREGDRVYDEMHVDGSVTTSLFAAPHSAQLSQDDGAATLPRNLYVVVNGKLAEAPQETPLNTVDVLSRSFAADLNYKTREALLLALDFSRRQHMRFQLTEIPPSYPSASFIDFSQAPMRALFDYAAACAARGQLWETPEHSIRRNMRGVDAAGQRASACPAVGGTAAP